MKSKNIGKFLSSSDTDATRWKFLLGQSILKHGNYALVADDSMQGVYCAVFASPEVQVYIQDLSLQQVKLGIFNIGNKGGIIAKMKIFESELKFCVCHLASGQKTTHLKERLDQIDQIYEKAFSAGVSDAIRCLIS